MLHGHFCGIFHLIHILTVKLCQCSSRHRAGCADLGLTAAFSAGNGGVALGQGADDTGSGQTPKDLLVGIAPGILGVFQHCRQHTAGTAGGSGDNRAVIRILLCYCISVGSDILEFPQSRHIFFRMLFQ